MRTKPLTLAQVKKHIRRCHKKGAKFDFLGLVENQDLTPEVERLFTFSTFSGASVYDWVNGNHKLKNLIREETTP